MIWRRIGGTLAGIATCIVVIMAVEAIGHMATGAPQDPARATTPMLLWVLAAWAVGPLAGGYVGVMVSRWRGAAWIVAAMVMLGVVATIMSMPTPAWLAAGGLGLPLIAAWLVSRRSPQIAAEA